MNISLREQLTFLFLSAAIAIGIVLILG